MKLHFDKEAGALCLRFGDSPIVEAEEVAPNVVLDYYELYPAARKSGLPQWKSEFQLSEQGDQNKGAYIPLHTNSQHVHTEE